MFWSGNYIVVRELNFLLKEENVTLSQVLEADDILQECKADNKYLIQFLTRPDILAELITLITEEPPPHVELTSQYRHASIACEVLTSHLSTLSDRLSMDVTQMNRLCDFLNKDPPLNPLLASYFSKTVEMLLERSPKQDWYLYHIVCLRVLDFFKSRRDFLPNLLRHMSTSAIADTFKYFIRLDDLFNKIIMEWFEEHQLVESLVGVVCGTYGADEPLAAAGEERDNNDTHNHQQEHKEHAENNIASSTPAESSPARLRRRLREVASANAAALLCEVAGGCAEGCARGRTAAALQARLRAPQGLTLLLQAVFTSPPAARAAAVQGGCRLLLALLARDPALTASDSEQDELELALAPHLPLLHHALLHDPRGEDPAPPGVGLPRVTLAALLAQLALAEHEDVCTTLITLGTPGVLVDMLFSFPDNNFLHAMVHALVANALGNGSYRHLYRRHLLLECDLLTRLMDAFEENENKKAEGQAGTRSAYMGHVVMMLESISRALDPAYDGGELALPAQLAARWAAFNERVLRPLLLQRHTPLGGYYPSENIYEVENMADTLAPGYDFNDMAATANLDDGLDADEINELQLAGAGGRESADFAADGLGLRDEFEMENAKSRFLELANQRVYDDDSWECAEEAAEEGPAEEADLVRRVQEVLTDGSPWESSGCVSGGGGGGGGSGGAAGGWASFGDGFTDDPFAPPPAHTHTQNDNSEESMEQSMLALRLEESLADLSSLDKPLDDAGSVELANNLLHAMSHMAPHDLANIVNANLGLLPPPPPPPEPAPSSPHANRDDSPGPSAVDTSSLANIVNANLGLQAPPPPAVPPPAPSSPNAESNDSSPVSSVADPSSLANIVNANLGLQPPPPPSVPPPAPSSPPADRDDSPGPSVVDTSSNIDSNANTASEGSTADDSAAAVDSSSPNDTAADTSSASDSAAADGGDS